MQCSAAYELSISITGAALTHWGRDNGRNFGRLHIECIFLYGNDRIQIQISLKLGPRGPNNDKAVLVQLLAWRRTGDKPLPEPMIIKFTDAYMRH